jgi:rhodanese-related sulfurtransferase
MYKDISASQFQEEIKNNADAIVIDVRTPGEVMEGVIPGAIHMDIMGGRFREEVEELDKNKPYYVYCRSGNRSGTACSFMAQLGFTELYNLSGGVMAWPGELVELQRA